MDDIIYVWQCFEVPLQGNTEYTSCNEIDEDFFGKNSKQNSFELNH